VLLVALAGTSIAIFAGCGLDVIGTRHPDASEAPGKSDAPEVDAPATVPSPTSIGSEAATDAGLDGIDGTALTPGCDPSDPTLMLCLDFEDGVRDLSSHAQPVDVAGSITYAAGPHGRAAVLTTTSRLHVANGTAWTYSALSIEMRVSPLELPASGARAGLLDKDFAFGLFLHPDGVVDCFMTAHVSAGVASIGKWTALACVDDGTNVVLYADGAQVASAAVAGSLPLSGELVAIGGNSPDGEPFIGRIDDVRVFSRALTPSEIAADR
jgi:hypothetical protein